jgi:hypothetical protein
MIHSRFEFLIDDQQFYSLFRSSAATRGPCPSRYKVEGTITQGISNLEGYIVLPHAGCALHDRIKAASSRDLKGQRFVESMEIYLRYLLLQTTFQRHRWVS